MSHLLDTHVLLWWFAGDTRLSERATEVIQGDRTEVFVSSVTGFEIATKKALGKLEAPDDLEYQLAENGFGILPVTMRHGLVAGALPLRHKDPFDRLLVAQAQCEGLTLVSADPALKSFEVGILPARRRAKDDEPDSQ